MSQYYNPKRSADWNYGGPKWRLSRSKIDLFLECRRCFYLDNKLGVARPKGYPFSLNSAVDALLKKEFDIHRAQKKTHPLMEKYGVLAVPFQHKSMNVWRDPFKGIEVKHTDTGFTVCGAVDDIWINTKEELHVVDYKATSKNGEVTLDAQWQEGYKRQMEIYQWLLRHNGFTVSDMGYFVYANGLTDAEAFDAKLEFDVKVIPYTGKDTWVGKTLTDIKECLTSDSVPSAGNECDYCPYREGAGKALQSRMKKNVAKTTIEAPKTGNTKSLF